jgi:hypothetical protein
VSSTVEYGGAAQAVSLETYGNLTLSGSGTKTAAAGTITVAGSFTNNAGTFVPGGGANTISMTGAGTTIGGAQATTFNNLTIGNTVSLNGVDTTVGATLALGSTVLSTGLNKVIVTSAIAPTRTSGYVDGALQRPGATGTVTFAVGNGTNYTPMDITFIAGSTGNLTVRSTAGEDANAGSGIDQNHDVNTYWTLTPSGTLNFPTSPTVSATFTYPSGNVDSGSTPASFLVKRWNGSTWSFVAVSGTPTSTSTSVTGLTSATLGEFVIGN